MNFISRLSNGWQLALAGFSVIRKNKKLILLPLLSGFALIITTGSFLMILLAGFGWDTGAVVQKSSTTEYILAFMFYLVNYFVIIFFNMALVHCARLHFTGEEVSLEKGLTFSMSKIGDIIAWSVFAATIGLIFKLIEENLGKFGQIISGLIGMAWSITTFFVVPVIAYENVHPFKAFKRSASMIKEKWGESLGATFSFGILRLLGILILAVPLFLIGMSVNLVLGIALGALAAFLVFAIISATEIIFISAVYQHLNKEIITDFEPATLDAAFVLKSKKGII